jgi:hypothetical protein
MNEPSRDQDENSGFDIHAQPLLSRVREIDAAFRDFARDQPLATAALALAVGYFFGRVMRKL